MYKRIDAIDLRKYDDDSSIRRAIYEVLKKDGFANSNFMLRGFEGLRLAELMPKKSETMNIYSDPSSWFFASHISFKKPIYDINSPLIHAFSSEKPMLAVFNSSCFSLNSDREYYLKEHISPDMAFTKAYLLQVSDDFFNR